MNTMNTTTTPAFRVVLPSRMKHLMVQVLIYTQHLFPEDASRKCVLVNLMNKKKEVFYDPTIDGFDRTLYMLDPHQGPYTVPVEALGDVDADDDPAETITIGSEIMDEKNLYPAGTRKDDYELAFHLVLEASSREVVDRFLESAVRHYFSEVRGDGEVAATLNVYQYDTDSESWEKFNEVVCRSLDTVYLPRDDAIKIHDDVKTFYKAETKAVYEKFGIPYHKTYCLFGPPGSGKTSLINAIASSLKKNICVLRLNSKMTDNDLSSSMCSWFPKNAMLVIDDVDCVLNGREDLKGNITFSALLNLLDGFSSNTGLVVFITTNHFLQLDSAIKRPGRVDYLLEFTYIKKDQVYKMLEVFYPDEREDFDTVYQAIKDQKMTVSYLQKFLFSLYPTGGIRAHLDAFLTEFHEHYHQRDLGLYA